MQKEAKARIKIDGLLVKAGWRFFDCPEGKANITVEKGMKIENLGDNFEKTKHGIADYILLDDREFPICILEAKSEDKNPLVGKEQARNYTKNQNARYIILSNGNIHYFWDRLSSNPTCISYFPTLDSLESREKFNPDSQRLIQEDVREDYIVLTQNPLCEFTHD